MCINIRRMSQSIHQFAVTHCSWESWSEALSDIFFWKKISDKKNLIYLSMKCSIGFLLIAFGAFQMISAWPVGSGSMVLYQPDYYRHRAFVMHYASQPVKSYHRRQGQAATSLYAAGKKISTGSYVGSKFFFLTN